MASAGVIRLRPSAARGRMGGGRADQPGIVATEAFSRGDTIDPAWMGWGVLRVLSRQDWAPGAVRDDGRVANMERLLLVLEGAMDVDGGGLGRHRVEAGGTLWIGTGHGASVRLANASARHPLRLLECWLQPDRVNAPPGMAVRAPAPPPDGQGEGSGAWSVLAGGGGVDALPLRQQARLLAARIAAEGAPILPPGDGRRWLEVLEGEVTVDATTGGTLAAGDGLAWSGTHPGPVPPLRAASAGPAWLLLLELPA